MKKQKTIYLTRENIMNLIRLRPLHVEGVFICYRGGGKNGKNGHASNGRSH